MPTAYRIPFGAIAWIVNPATPATSPTRIVVPLAERFHDAGRTSTPCTMIEHTPTPASRSPTDCVSQP